MNRQFWQDRRVLITGHTGFKGSWLSLMLANAGARVSGISLEPPTCPALFEVAGIPDILENHFECDIRDRTPLLDAVLQCAPQVVFHLAAQPLVRASYDDPVGTFDTNVVGLVNVLDCLRQVEGLEAVLNVTTDKVYANDDLGHRFTERDRIGGKDPYSASKACSELVTDSWRSSFYSAKGIGLASARAGNVIGGGDWADDRLIPDAMRAIDQGTVLSIRSPMATRPWQHVLEPLAGYVSLLEALVENPEYYSRAWNFGPAEGDARCVSWVADYISDRSDGFSWESTDQAGPKEAGLLEIDSTMAIKALNWRPRWSVEQALDRTLTWYERFRAGADMRQLCISQINDHSAP